MADQIIEALKFGMLNHALKGTLYHTAASEQINVAFHVHTADRTGNPPTSSGNWLAPHSSAIATDVAFDDAVTVGSDAISDNTSDISLSNVQQPSSLSGTADKICWVSIHKNTDGTVNHDNVILAIDLGASGVAFNPGDTIQITAGNLDVKIT